MSTQQSSTHSEVNCATLRNGRVVAVCQFCDRRSKSSRPDLDGEPSMWDIPGRWAETPFPHDCQHADGSAGSLFTCPSCNKRLKAGETLQLRAGRAKQWARVVS